MGLEKRDVVVCDEKLENCKGTLSQSARYESHFNNEVEACVVAAFEHWDITPTGHVTCPRCRTAINKATKEAAAADGPGPTKEKSHARES
ncbi:MAG: hypothetical protein V3R81_02085 [Gammaproteobacteria bacterium]